MTNALENLMSHLNLLDGWRRTYPDTRAYTFLQEASSAQLRLDRIYVTNNLLCMAREWKIESYGISGSDHDLASVQVAHKDAPLVGKRCWAISPHFLKDKILKDFAHKLGHKTLEK